jgi:hypothetical protein
MPILCPCCDHEHDLIFYAKIPLGLSGTRYKGEPIITEKTDVTCINCYWQGTLGELLSNEEVGRVQTAKNRAKAVLGG